MPLIDGVGDEVLWTALVAIVPLFFVIRASLGGRASSFAARGVGIFREACSRGIGAMNRVVRRGSHAEPVVAGPANAAAAAADADDAATASRSTSGARGRSTGMMRDMDSPPENDCCAICHERFTVPCQANCSHWFCGECILGVWEHGSRRLNSIQCPICRRLVNLIIPSQAPEWRTADPALSQRVLQGVAMYNRMFGGGPVSFWQRIRDMPLLLRRLAWEFSDPQRAYRQLHNVRLVCCLLLVVLYVLSPFDIIPEFLLGFLGLLDDILLLGIVAYYVSILYRSALLAVNAQHQ
eukprot:TRINITY_DN9667_c0_g1_i1.p1 TRINITY_DN9667_c0_g1~~TRINITY_DN9667_c0_g1_i1.p1  ORF type:complete len:295 (+),score=42.62 TRINITY_DN9667_c0_g1_i1:830-1714(+)